MNVAAIAIIAENFAILAGVWAAYRLLRQGGGVQVKPVPVPKATAPSAADKTVPFDLDQRRTGT